ncbi:MAG: hypothetical protein JXA73_07300 [Acidobacteria bacterium]|nr:hypothetical protein [Acidobacteriota bacterium]
MQRQEFGAIDPSLVRHRNSGYADGGISVADNHQRMGFAGEALSNVTRAFILRLIISTANFQFIQRYLGHARIFHSHHPPWKTSDPYGE